MTPEQFNAWRALALGSMFAGLMAAPTVVRNPRAQEGSGQAELLASGATMARVRRRRGPAPRCQAGWASRSS